MEPGERYGRYVIVRDVEGRIHAVSPTSVAAICDDGDGGCILLLPGARMVRVGEDIELVLEWLLVTPWRE